MKKSFMFMSFMIMAVSIALLSIPVKASAADLQVKWFGYSQITVEGGDGVKKDESDPRIGADRVRIGYNAKLGNVFSKLQIDFNKAGLKTEETTTIADPDNPSNTLDFTPALLTSASNTNILPNIIKDAEVGYKFNNSASVKVGMFKTPVGMDFNVSGKKLDITKRGMEKALVLERSLGIMASGRNIAGGFGYDIGYFNPTTRSAAVSGGTPGDDKAYAVRGMYDMGKMLHVEASYGKSEKANGNYYTGEDYTVLDVGASYKMQGATIKAEYIDGKNVKGVDGKDQAVWYLHAGYQFTPMYETVVRYYQGNDDLSDTSLSNTFIGLNVYLNPAKKYNSRIQLNYVLASGDTDTWAGLGGYKDDAILAQYQVAF
ncbi:MAG: porin [Nitrospirota bacterium]|nr:porin [Nitrospirota bacterium]